MNTALPVTPSVSLPGACRTIRAFGDTVLVHLDGALTGGAFTFTLFTNITPPGGGPPPHYHAGEDECFYVLEGRVEFFQDGAWAEVPAGTVVFIPKGVVHTFRNIGDQPLKQLVRTNPSGFEIFFARSEAEFAKPGGPDMQRLVAIAAEHGIHFVQP